MAGLTYFFAGEHSVPLDEAETKGHHRSRITVIQFTHEDSCHAHFWIPNSMLGGRWFKHGPLSICFLSNEKKPKILENSEARETIFKSAQGNYFVDAESEDLNFSFITMGLEAQEYRTLVDGLGGHQAIEALLAVNDIISMREYRPDSPKIKNHRLRNKVIKSLVRRTEQSFLLDNGVEILRGNERASIDAARPEFRCDFRLPDGREYGFDFQFGSTQELGQRIAVLIGKNGSGKTQTLRHTAKLALGSLSNEWRGNFTPSRVIGFYSGHRISKVFPPQTLKRMVSGYRVCNIADEAGRSSAGVIDVLLQMIETDTRLADTTRFSILLESLKQARGRQPTSIFHEHYGPIDLSNIRTGGRGSIEFFRPDIGYVEESTSDFLEAIDRSKGVFGRELNDFSSGEEAYVRFCIFSSAYTENGSLVLLDEPEVFLHPQFIDALMGALQKVLELTGSVAVVATHSAYVVRCVQEDMVHIIREKEWHSFDNRVEIQKTRMKTFGADVGLISLFVFGEDEMETTTNRALGYISRSGQDASSLRAIVSEDLLSKIVNKHEED
ncbi:AAA family ATPase [Tritonibacter mobilis]|uniref:AAA family ATPase n=1 Tax=Tritonibacter mobilis TaxID=379347 RepID=UPI001C08D0E0|nr:AAA family ATPase [Tritonibacter mobilis]MBU3033920.1 ATP-binding protein [Tritonibacter mobilis]WHQ84971.1 AAA family ATPase [Tritonibacter mobilis]